MQKKNFILCELQAMKKDCAQKHMSEMEWVEKYADKFQRKFEISQKRSNKKMHLL